jgi:xanthine dehydrogenase accessory factor
VLIERLDEIERDEIARDWLNVLERGERAALVTPLGGASGRLLVHEIGEPRGQLSDPSVEREAVAQARMRLRAAVPHSGPERLGSSEVFYEISTPPPEIVIFGANPDVAPLAHEAWTLGFAVTIVDVRSAYLTQDQFPHAKLVLAHFNEFPGAVPLGSETAVLVMNHHIERDEESLRYALESDASYIGVLGPRSRYLMLLENLGAKGYVPSPSQLARVHSPVGLAIGAETPREIAVSILGELIAVSRGFRGGLLSGSEGRVHAPDDNRLLTSS